MRTVTLTDTASEASPILTDLMHVTLLYITLNQHQMTLMATQMLPPMVYQSMTINTIIE